MNRTFPTPSDVVGALRTMYTQPYELDPHESLFSLLLHSNGQLAGVACLPAHPRDEHLRTSAEKSEHRDDVSMIVLVAVCHDPSVALHRAAGYYRPYPVMLIGTDSLKSGDWHEYVTGETGTASSSLSHGSQRFLGHWEYCKFSETFARDRHSWYASKPTRFKSIEKPLERFVKSIADGRPSSDYARTGGVLVYSETSRDEALRAVDLNPHQALAAFQAAARGLIGQARIEALVAAGIAAFFAGERGIAEHAYLIARQESDSEAPRFDERMLSALGALVSEKVTAKSATELVQMHPRAARLGETDRKSA